MTTREALALARSKALRHGFRLSGSVDGVAVLLGM